MALGGLLGRQPVWLQRSSFLLALGQEEGLGLDPSGEWGELALEEAWRRWCWEADEDDTDDDDNLEGAEDDEDEEDDDKYDEGAEDT